jgi:hypothetical protein
MNQASHSYTLRNEYPNGTKSTLDKYEIGQQSTSMFNADQVESYYQDVLRKEREGFERSI